MSEDTQHGLQSDAHALHQVASIVCAYVSHNSIRPADLPELIASIHGSIQGLVDRPQATDVKGAENPAVPVKKSVSKEFIVCLEDGKKFKSLRRHLSSFHGMTPDDYRAKWNLGGDYPMVAPAYSATRSQLAKESGLGQVSRSSVAEPATPAPKTAGRGRPRKTAG